MLDFQLDIIRGIQSIFKSDFMTTLMKLLTQLGDQFAFLGVLLVLYWFISKRSAYKMMFAFAGSQFVNVFLKALIKVDRPFIKDPSVGIGSPTEGYSFPSGHATNAGSIATVLHVEYNKKAKWLKWVLLALIIIVPVTRVYLGQHYPTDVIVGLILSIIISYFMVKLVDKMGDKEDLYGLYMVPVLAIVLVIFSFFLKAHDYENYKNLFVTIGALIGFFGGYYIDKNYIKYDTQVKGLTILWRSLIGLVIVAISYVGLSIIFDKISEHSLLLDALRYGLIALCGTALSSKVFKLLKV